MRVCDFDVTSTPFKCHFDALMWLCGTLKNPFQLENEEKEPKEFTKHPLPHLSALYHVGSKFLYYVPIHGYLQFSVMSLQCLLSKCKNTDAPHL